MDLCDSCIHARDSEKQAICHAFRWLIQMSEEIASKVADEDTPIMRLGEPLLAVTECRAYETSGRTEARGRLFAFPKATVKDSLTAEQKKRPPTGGPSPSPVYLGTSTATGLS